MEYFCKHSGKCFTCADLSRWKLYGIGINMVLHTVFNFWKLVVRRCGDNSKNGMTLEPAVLILTGKAPLPFAILFHFPASLLTIIAKYGVPIRKWVGLYYALLKCLWTWWILSVQVKYSSWTRNCFTVRSIGVFPKWNWHSVNLANLISHWSRNYTQFKDSVSHNYHAGAVVASWSLTLETTGSNPFNDKYFLSLNSVETFREKSNVFNDITQYFSSN